jgi:hypothetical protein
MVSVSAYAALLWVSALTGFQDSEPGVASVCSAQRPGPVAVAAVFPEFIAREQPGRRGNGRQGRSVGSGAARSAARTRPGAP